MSRKACLLVNPSAGGGHAARVLPTVRDTLTGLGVEFHVVMATDIDHARDVAGAAARDGQIVVTLGGDGLAGCAAGALHGVPGAVLGVLPGGRGNDLARVLGIPHDPAAACAVIAGGRERDLDLGEIDGRYFVGIASLGFDSEANRIANEAPKQLGRGVYAYGALRALATWRPATFDVDHDAGSSRFVGYSVAAANARAYGGGMYVAPDAELDDGMLDVVVTEAMPRRRFLANLPKVFRGAHVDEPEVHVLRTRIVRIATDRPFTVYADGDPIGRTPVTITTVPRALRVLVPAALTAAA